MKGDAILYIYTNSQHNNPLCRVVSIENIQGESLTYDKEKYKEMILDVAETVLAALASTEMFISISKRRENIMLNCEKKGERLNRDDGRRII